MPFNIVIMKVDREKVKTLKPVSSTDIMGSSGQNLSPVQDTKDMTLSWSGEKKLSSNFHEDGLFSISIFGRVGDPERDKRFSFVDIKVGVFHPVIYKALSKLNKLYPEIMSGKSYAVWDEKEKDFVLSNEMDGRTGFSFFVKHWEDIKFKESKSPTRNDRVKLINKYKAIAMTDKLLVLPAGLRDVRVGGTGRLEFDEINDLYRKIVGISRTVSKSGESFSSPVLDYSRHQLQQTFNSVYEYLENMLKGKKGFIQGKWAKRKVFNGTRNVISAMNTSKKLLGDKNSFRTTDTILGLFQVLRGALPIALNRLRNGYLADAVGFGNVDNYANLVDPVSLKKEVVNLDPITKDKWTTVDGLEKVINSFEQEENRHKPVMVEDRYLALVYKGPDMTFRVFGDIDELPATLDRKYVSPITLAELLYLSGYKDWNKLKVIVTRYPVTGLGSTYPSNLYVRTTTVGEQRKELGPDWQPIGDDHIASEFPRSDVSTFLESQIVSSTRLAGLGGDYDGDTCSALIVYSDDVVEEINKNLSSREAYVDASGRLRTSVGTDTLNLVLRNMTGAFGNA